MNRTCLTEPDRVVSPEPLPLVLALCLSLRLRELFPQIRQSATLLAQWLRATLRSMAGWRSAALAVDDPLEQVLPDLEAALANDPPAQRRRILAAVRATHARTEALATNLNSRCPPALLADESAPAAAKPSMP